LPSEQGAAPPGPLARRAGLALAVAAHLALAVPMTRAAMVFSEEFTAMVSPAARVMARDLDPAGGVTWEPSCAGARSWTFVASEERPVLALCVRDRAYPLLDSRYTASVFTWPLELLRGLHGDDPVVERRMLLVIGAASLALIHAVASRLAGARVAALAALATAVSPCFVLVHAVAQPFETLPWLFVLAAVALLSTCPALAPPRADEPPARAPPPDTYRLVAAAACVGLALAASFKAVLLLAPLVALALRLRVRFGRIAPRQWLLGAGAAAAAFTPVVLGWALGPATLALDGRAASWRSNVLENLAHPERFPLAAGEMLRQWADTGAYLFGGAASLPSLVVVTAAFVFVVADTVRTWIRGRGCAFTAACGTILLAWLVAVGLLYVSFPVNFIPLHGVFGAALGATLGRAAGWAGRRLTPRITAALALAAVAPVAWATWRDLGISAEVGFVTNNAAQGALTRYLAARPEPPARPVTINLLAGGVVDRLSGGGVATVQAHRVFIACEHEPEGEAMDGCLRARWRAVLDDPSLRAGARVITSASGDVVHRPRAFVRAQLAQLAAAAGDLHREVRLERAFPAPGGQPAAELHLVGPRREPTDGR
jgi:hypothetical protein